MIDVCALTSGELVPSANFRVRQYRRHLGGLGVRVHERRPLWDKFSAPPASVRRVLRTLGSDRPEVWKRLQSADRLRGTLASYRHDITWIQKVLVPNRLTWELRTGGPRVFDLDDAIWLADGQGFLDKIVAGCDEVFAGNDYLAEWAAQYARRVTVIPTGVDTDIYAPAPERRGDRFVVGWIGTSGNYKYMASIIGPLRAFLERRRDAVLQVIGDRYPHELAELGDRLEFLPWHPLAHLTQMREFAVGLMPIAADDWCRGKCSYKMLQYMSMGIPVIASPFGMNEAVLAMRTVGVGARSPGDWYAGLDEIYLQTGLARRMGMNGREVIVQHYCSKLIAARIAVRFGQLCR